MAGKYGKQGKYAEEFASETNAEEVKKQNQEAAKGNYRAEFGSETNVSEVRKQVQQAEQNKK